MVKSSRFWAAHFVSPKWARAMGECHIFGPGRDLTCGGHKKRSFALTRAHFGDPKWVAQKHDDLTTKCGDRISCFCRNLVTEIDERFSSLDLKFLRGVATGSQVSTEIRRSVLKFLQKSGRPGAGRSATSRTKMVAFSAWPHEC